MASRQPRRTLVLACLAVVVSGYPQAAWAEDRQLFMLVTDPSDQPLPDIRADAVDLQMAGAECTIKSRDAVGLEARRDRLRKYVTWTTEDLAEFSAALCAQRVVDERDWQ